MTVRELVVTVKCWHTSVNVYRQRTGDEKGRKGTQVKKTVRVGVFPFEPAEPLLGRKHHELSTSVLMRVHKLTQRSFQINQS